MEFVLGRFSHFNIAIAYSNSKFCGAWTPKFLWVHFKFQQNEHTPGGQLFTKINLLFTTKQYENANIANFVYYGKISNAHFLHSAWNGR